MCRPSATIAAAIMAPHRMITPQVLRSFAACPAPMMTWRWRPPAMSLIASSLPEIGVNDLDQSCAWLRLGQGATLLARNVKRAPGHPSPEGGGIGLLDRPKTAAFDVIGPA